MNNICSKIFNIFKIVGKIALVIAATISFFAAIYFATDFAFKNVLSFNARAVLANFIVFSIIIAFALRQAVHPKAMLEQAQTVVENEIKDSEKAKKENVPVISSMGTGNKFHPEKFKIVDISKTNTCPLAKVMRYELRQRGINHVDVLYSEEITVKTNSNVPGSIAYVPSAAGILIASFVINKIIEK